MGVARGPALPLVPPRHVVGAWSSFACFPSTSTIWVPRPIVPIRHAARAPDLEAIFRDHATRVARWAARAGITGVDVDDVVQEVFEVTMRRFSVYQGEPQLLAWLSQTTHQVARARRRRDAWRRWSPDPNHLFEVPSGAPSQFDVCASREAVARLDRVLAGMNPKYRKLLVMAEVEGVSADEMAATMGARVSTVWVWLHRARAQFKERLEAERAQ